MSSQPERNIPEKYDEKGKINQFSILRNNVIARDQNSNTYQRESHFHQTIKQTEQSHPVRTNIHFGSSQHSDHHFVSKTNASSR